MNLRLTSEEPKFNFLDHVRQLTDRIATIDPTLILDHYEKWIDLENTNIQFKPEEHDKLTEQVERYKKYRERSFLIDKRKRYELTSLFARNMLCRSSIVPEITNQLVIKQWSRPFSILALLLIDEMHTKWRNREDLSLLVPPALETDKKKIIEDYLHTIQTLNTEKESEGTYAYLLHDYCRTMIIYNCAMQFVYGADLETLRSAYGEYAEEAFTIYDDMIGELEALNDIDDEQYDEE